MKRNNRKHIFNPTPIGRELVIRIITQDRNMTMIPIKLIAHTVKGKAIPSKHRKTSRIETAKFSNAQPTFNKGAQASAQVTIIIFLIETQEL